jgi:hypothetical protein
LLLSQLQRGLRLELSSPARTLRSWVRIPLEGWMSVCVCSVCRQRPCDVLLSRPRVLPTVYRSTRAVSTAVNSCSAVPIKMVYGYEFALPERYHNQWTVFQSGNIQIGVIDSVPPGFINFKTVSVWGGGVVNWPCWSRIGCKREKGYAYQ